MPAALNPAATGVNGSGCYVRGTLTGLQGFHHKEHKDREARTRPTRVNRKIRLDRTRVPDDG
jgi:hypothetical protein